MTENELPEDAIKFVAMLTGMQVVLNCQLELKGTPYYQDKVRKDVHQAVESMKLFFHKQHKKIWKVDETKAADLMMAIHTIAKLIAQDNGIGINAIATLLRKDVDLTRVIIKEMTDEELRGFIEENDGGTHTEM